MTLGELFFGMTGVLTVWFLWNHISTQRNVRKHEQERNKEMISPKINIYLDDQVQTN